MGQRQFGVECPGGGCPVKPENHCHMPPEETLPNNLRVSTDAQAIAQAILGSFEGLAGNEEEYSLGYEAAGLTAPAQHEPSTERERR